MGETMPQAPTCDDCVECPCVCIPAVKWITERIRAGRGDVTFTLNENGDIMVMWWNDSAVMRRARGDTAEEAIAAAEATDNPPHLRGGRSGDGG
jgi:hypothetical protein